MLARAAQTCARRGAPASQRARRRRPGSARARRAAGGRRRAWASAGPRCTARRRPARGASRTRPPPRRRRPRRRRPRRRSGGGPRRAEPRGATRCTRRWRAGPFQPVLAAFVDGRRARRAREPGAAVEGAPGQVGLDDAAPRRGDLRHPGGPPAGGGGRGPRRGPARRGAGAARARAVARRAATAGGAEGADDAQLAAGPKPSSSTQRPRGGRGHLRRRGRGRRAARVAPGGAPSARRCWGRSSARSRRLAAARDGRQATTTPRGGSRARRGGRRPHPHLRPPAGPGRRSSRSSARSTLPAAVPRRTWSRPGLSSAVSWGQRRAGRSGLAGGAMQAAQEIG